MRINGFGRVVSVGLGIVAFFALAAPVSSAPPSGETFTLDATHSSATFRVHHMGAGPFYGRFNKVEGTIVFDGKNSLEMDVAVIVDSVDTGSERLDGHLKSPDFFNAKEFPKMTFKSRSAKNLRVPRFMDLVSGDKSSSLAS